MYILSSFISANPLHHGDCCAFTPLHLSSAFVYCYSSEYNYFQWKPCSVSGILGDLDFFLLLGGFLSEQNTRHLQSVLRRSAQQLRVDRPWGLSQTWRINDHIIFCSDPELFTDGRSAQRWLFQLLGLTNGFIYLTPVYRPDCSSDHVAVMLMADWSWMGKVLPADFLPIFFLYHLTQRCSIFTQDLIMDESCIKSQDLCTPGTTLICR